MFCPNCGKELSDNAKFCAHCGKPVIVQDQQSVHQSIIQDHAAPEQDSSDAAGGSPQKSAIFTQKKSKNTKVFICLAAALILVIGVVFAVRAFNEQAMIREIPFAIYNDGGGEKVEAYYKDYFGESFTIGCNAEDFSITRGADSNSYNLIGKFEVTDTSQDSRPTYDAYVTGTVTTNFFRTKWSINWSLQYQTPEDSGTDSPDNSVAYPPTLPPIDPNADLYSRYFGLYVNKEGYALEVGMGSDMYSSYYARIYQNLSDARNYAEPLLEVSGGEADYGTQGMGIAFKDILGEIYLFREDDLDKITLLLI